MSIKINKSLLVSFFFVFLFKLANGQNLEVEGEAKISQMQLKNKADSLVVSLPDGTLAIRDASSLPDADSTNELQMLSIANDSLLISGGNKIGLKAYKPSFELDADTLSTDKRVGIGTNSPSEKLQVKGGIKADSLFISGKIKVNVTDKINTADSVVVRLSDGTLAIRDVASLPTSSGGWTLVTGGSDESQLTLDGTEKLVLKNNLQGDLQLSVQNSSPSQNLFFGENSGDSITSGLDFDGKYNTGIGNFTFIILEKGSMNTAVGKSAMAFTRLGSYNTAVGAQSLLNNYSGNNNVAIGNNSMFYNSTGSDNVAVGDSSLWNSRVAKYNVAVGKNALFYSKDKSKNTAVGYYAMSNFDNSNVIDDTYNTAVGYEALKGGPNPASNFGTSNTAIGAQVLTFNTNGSLNTGIGSFALYSNKEGDYNTALGYSALGYNTFGSRNTAVGIEALLENKTRTEMTAVGAYALKNSNSSTADTISSANTAIGYEAMRGSDNSADNTGVNNTVVGHQSLKSFTSGGDNTSIGKSALEKNTSGSYNIGIGSYSSLLNTGGSGNISIGHRALESNVSGGNNVAIGGEAGKSTQGSRNVFIGFNAGKSATGDNKLFIHNGDENNSFSLIYGEFDNKLLKINGRTEVVEASTTNASIAGIKNYAPGIVVNNLAGVYGENIVDDALGIGVFGVGSYAGVYGLSDKTNSPESIGVIGVAAGANTGTNYGLYGYAANANDPNLNYAVYANGNLVYTGTAFGPSDEKLKRNINSISSVLSKILLLKPSIYMMRNSEFPGMSLPETPQVGFIAQDLQMVFPDLVSKQVHTSIDGHNGRSIKSESIDFLGVNYIGMIPILTKGIQEQQELITRQNQINEKQAEEIKSLNLRLEKLEKLVTKLAAE